MRVSGREMNVLVLCMELSCIIHLQVTNLYSYLNYMNMKFRNNASVLDNQKKKKKVRFESQIVHIGLIEK